MFVLHDFGNFIIQQSASLVNKVLGKISRVFGINRRFFSRDDPLLKLAGGALSKKILSAPLLETGGVLSITHLSISLRQLWKHSEIFTSLAFKF